MKKTIPITLAARPVPSRGRSLSEARGLLTTLLATGCFLAGSLAAQAQNFPINEGFIDAAAPNFTLGGSATLTGTAGAPGYLRLTSDTNNQAGYAVLNGTFPSSKGFSISFEFFAYVGTGADGFSVFMVDADGTDPTKGEFSIGAYGGSLGYAQIDAGLTQPGVSKGYLGIGFDEFGNYSQANESRVGGPGFTPQAVALRGSAADAYKYLTGSNTLPFSLDVATARAQPGSDDYRKAYVYVIPTNGGYTITIRLQHGHTVTTTTNNYAVTAPPANLRVGFAGSTGAQTDIHEIRNLAILDNPYAVDDEIQTPYNQPITLNVADNDHGIGAELVVSTVDLDPDTPGIQQTYTVAGQGTFSVDNQGVVTFMPIGTFAGEVTLPYVISDIVNKISNPALITINVAGADVASAISGPVSASAGTNVTYTISTSNNGALLTNNVYPTLQLPMGTSLPDSPDYIYDKTTGLVTFSPVTLAVGNKVFNSLSFDTPVDNPGLVMISSYAYPANATIPDPVASNNTATLSLASTSPLPVELTRFDVAAAPQGTLLTWHTATEQHNDHFTVERSVTGSTFRAIGTVRSQGNGPSPHDYSFTDSGAGQLGATTLYYRLQQVDADGTTTYSPVRNVRFAAPKATATLYPNPSQGQTLLDLSSLAAGPYLVQVLDLTGRVLRTQHAAAEVAPLDLSGLPQGAYLVLVQGAGTRQALPLLRN